MKIGKFSQLQTKHQVITCQINLQKLKIPKLVKM